MGGFACTDAEKMVFCEHKKSFIWGVRRMAMPFDPEDAYYEWQDRVNVLQDVIDAIDSRMG